MPLSGYTNTTPAEVALNPALVKVGAAVWGITRAGVKFDEEVTWATLAGDGITTPIKGTVRKEKIGGKLSFTIIEFGKALGVQLQRLDPGSTVTSQAVAGSPTDTITPLGAGVFLPDAGYLTDVRAYWQLGDGARYFAIYMPCCYVSKAPITGADTGEAEAAVELVGVIDPAVQGLNDAPYKKELWDEVPTA